MTPSRPATRLAAALLAVLAVPACQPKRGTAPVAQGTGGGAPAAAETANARDTQTARGRAAETARGETSETPEAPRIRPIDANAQRMLGADADGLAARLGEPTRQRREAAARVWQYRLDACVLDVVLYPESGKPVVAHLEARDRSGARMPTDRCLRRLLEKRATRQNGATRR